MELGGLLKLGIEEFNGIEFGGAVCRAVGGSGAEPTVLEFPRPVGECCHCSGTTIGRTALALVPDHSCARTGRATTDPATARVAVSSPLSQSVQVKRFMRFRP